MPLGEAFAAVRQRDMQLDDEMPVAGLVQGSARAFAPLNDPQERERRQLPFGVALLHACPDGSALRGVFAKGKRVQQAELPRIGDPLQRRRGAFVLFVARALEQCGVAREEV